MYITPDLLNFGIAQMLLRRPLYRQKSCRRGLRNLIILGILLVLPPPATAQEDGSEARDPEVLYSAGAHREALDIWMLRAFEGDSESQFRVGVLFGEGKGVQQDFEQSAYWFTQAARQGHTAAQYNLGHAYYSGTGIGQSETDALTWWEAAAKGGHELAQYNMGRANYMGIATEKNPETARFWFSQAAANGEPRSREILEKLGWEMVPAVHIPQPTGPDSPGLPDLEQPDLVTAYPDSRPEDSTPQASPSLTTDNTGFLPTAGPESPAPAEADKQELAPDDTAVSTGPAVPPSPATIPDAGLTGTPASPVETADSEESVQVIVRERPVNIAQGEQELALPVQDVPAPSPDSGGQVPVYSTPRTGGLLIGVVSKDADWRIINRSGDWLRVTRTPGFPVWVHRDNLTITDATATIAGDRVQIRTVPVVSDTSILGTVQLGQTYDVLAQQGEWVRIVSPTNIAAWVKEQDLDARAVSTVPPGDNQASEWRTVGVPDPTTGRLKDDEAWLYSQSPESFTIQIISLANEQGVIDFVRKQGLDGDAHYYTTPVGDTVLYVLRYGSYASQELAFAASAELPLAGQAIWIRKIGTLQQDRCQSLEKAPETIKAGLSEWCAAN